MKINQSLIPILLFGLVNFQYPTDNILINGKIICILPKNVEHTWFSPLLNRQYLQG